MSTAELAPLFPSATHPALPIAASILSTLRNLTAPGKGNDLRPEERAALVGVAALLGCEKVHSKDLIESSAQKASSVSPAHFRAALSRSRAMLASLSSDTFSKSPSRRTSRSDSVSAPDAVRGSVSPSRVDTNQDVATLASLTGSPFQTPKKKWRFTSGVDISSLVKHSPSRGSPLKQSVTPSSRLEKAVTAATDRPNEERERGMDEDGEEARTPTKRGRFTRGVDLEVGPSNPASAGRSTRRREEDVIAFFALRPGGSGASAVDLGRGTLRDQDRSRSRSRSASPTPVDGPSTFLSFGGRQRGSGEREGKSRRKLKPRRDWTYAEQVWGGEEVAKANRAVLGKVWADLPVFLAPHGLPLVEQTEQGGKSVLEVLLSAVPSRIPTTEDTRIADMSNGIGAGQNTELAV